MAIDGKREVVVKLPESGPSERVAAVVDGVVAWFARHWLATFNTLIGIFFILPFLAPVFMHLGMTGVGHLIYVVYSPTCHQLPERSYFLFGPQVTYTVPQLQTAGVLPPGLNILQIEALRWPGSPALGYKVAFCERDAAMWGTLLLAGLVYGGLRKRYQRQGRRFPKLPLWGYALFLLPMAVDGFTQLFGWRESDWILRSITGILFGIATVWLAYPYVQDAMDDVLRNTPQRTAGGEVRPG